MTVSVVIVGAGLGGLELAYRLASVAGFDVTVVEAGPLDGVNHLYADHPGDVADSIWMEAGRDEHLWRPWLATSAAYGHGSGLRRRFGGRSLYWHGVVLPIERWALNEWPDAVAHDLGVDGSDERCYYPRVLEHMGRWRGAGFDDESSAVEIGGGSMCATPTATRQRLEGWEAYTPCGPVYARTLVGTIRVETDTRVIDIVSDGVTTTGIRVVSGGHERLIMADVVVISAATIESTRIVLQSLGRLAGARVHQAHGLSDKVTQGVVLVANPAQVDATLLALANRDGSFLYRPVPELRANFFIRIYRNSLGAVVVDSWLMGEQAKSSANSITCIDDGSSTWATVVSAGFKPEDHVTIGLQADYLRCIYSEICDRTGTPERTIDFPDAEAEENESFAASVLMPKDSPPSSNALTYLVPLGVEQHEAGTLPLGNALTSDGEVVGLPHTYVLGPASFSRTGAANPSLTVLALAWRLAEHLELRYL